MSVLTPGRGMPMRLNVRLRLTVLLCLTAAAASIDVVVKSTVHADRDFGHQRSPLWACTSIVLLLAMPLLARVPSRLIVVAAGLHTGGTLGNLISAGRYHGVVPNPLVLRGNEGGVAFNPADVFVLAGIVLLTIAAIRLTIRHRHVLPQSFVAVRLYRLLVAKRSG